MSDMTITIDDSIRRDAEALFEKLGLSVSAAVNAFFRQAIKEQAVPSAFVSQAGDNTYDEYFNPHNMKRLQESILQAENGEVIYFSLDELIDMETGNIPQRALDFLSKTEKTAV